MLDYQFWSAPVDDLTDWTSNGVNYQAKQDPIYNPYKMQHMYAPDVVKGNDGKYYLYYCMSGYGGKGCYANPISVAVSDKPDGIYKYLGIVQDKSGNPLMTYICFDPALINDDGKIRLYYGASFEFDEHRRFGNNFIFDLVQSKMFNRSIQTIRNTPGGVMGAFTVELEDDMLTAKTDPIRILGNIAKGTTFEEHGFFEASSIRKIDETYYFIYSSRKNHELCYATSVYPDRDFIYRGVIVSNGDIGYLGRMEHQKNNATGTNHGSIESVNGQWYVFYHRLTHLSDFSRQACAEPITILDDGSIPQVGITSYGLNNQPLKDVGTYPSVIACHITSNTNMPHGTYKRKTLYPSVFSDSKDRYIANIQNGTKIGYKNFLFYGENYQLTLEIRGSATGLLSIYLDEEKKQIIGKTELIALSEWHPISLLINVTSGEFPMFFYFEGEGILELLEFTLQRI